MIKSVSSWCAVALALAAFAVGCGGGSSNKSTSSSQTSSPPAASTQAQTTTTTSTAATPNAAAIQQAKTACQAVLALARTLPASVKAKVEAVCAKAEKGELASAQAAAKELCGEVINAIPTLSGAAKEQALAACKSGK